LKNRQLFYLLHALVWLVYIVFATLFRVASNPAFKVHILDIFFTYVPTIYVFYGNNFIFSRYLFGKRYFSLAFAEIVFYASFLGLYYIDGYWIAPLINPGLVQPPFRLASFVIQCSWLFFIYSYFSFGYVFAVQMIQKEKQLRIIESKKLQAERDRLVAEYSFLRSQINPHFLHNILSFFYSKSLGISQELSEGILILSEIMRYSLEDSDTSNGNVSLTKEVENLRKVIKIYQLRFSNKLHVDLAVSGDIDSVRIIPLILITIVENAFKHGELNNPLHPVRIGIEVGEGGRSLYFVTSNKKKSGPKELGYGIGMDNVKKRLEYAYQENQQIVIKDERDHYMVGIDIQFKKDQKTEPYPETMEKAS